MAKAAGRAVFITGDDEVDFKLAGMLSRVQTKLVRKATREIAKPVRDSAKAWAPYETGELAGSIKVRALKRSRKNKDSVGARVITSDTDSLFSGETYYGAFQEFGTEHMEANPFLLPAMLENERSAKSMFTKAMREIVKQEEAKK